MLARLFADVKSEEIDAVVLGCTHYPLISEHIKKYFPKANIYDGGLGTALQTKRRLSDSGLLILDEKKGSLTIINSAQDPSFEELANKYLKNITM